MDTRMMGPEKSAGVACWRIESFTACWVEPAAGLRCVPLRVLVSASGTSRVLPRCRGIHVQGRYVQRRRAGLYARQTRGDDFGLHQHLRRPIVEPNSLRLCNQKCGSSIDLRVRPGGTAQASASTPGRLANQDSQRTKTEVDRACVRRNGLAVGLAVDGLDLREPAHLVHWPGVPVASHRRMP